MKTGKIKHVLQIYRPFFVFRFFEAWYFTDLVNSLECCGVDVESFKSEDQEPFFCESYCLEREKHKFSKNIFQLFFLGVEI